MLLTDSDVKKNVPLSRKNDIQEYLTNQIINHSRSMISIINRNYVYEMVNATFCREHQIANDSVIGRSLSDVWGDDVFNEHIKGKIDLCFSGETVSYVASFNTARMGKRYFEVVFRPVTVGHEGITHLMAETFDINDLRVSRLEALEKQEELKNFETNFPIGFLRCRDDGKIIHANKAFIRLMECPDDILLQNFNFRIFYPVEVLFDTQVDQLFDSNSKSFGRVFLKNWRGNDIPCRLSGFMALDHNGMPAYIDFAIEDSSMELMLENRLLQAQKLETIGALAGGIAHDFNSILLIISGYSEMLLEDLTNDSPLSDSVIKIQGAVAKAQSIINQMLTFSRQVEQEKISVNVAEVLKETIGFVKSSVPPNIVIRQKNQGRNANVLADPTQLFRIFLNLMTNAIQSMEEAGGILSVNMEIADGKLAQVQLHRDIVADEYVLLTFSDTGQGMDPSVLERIFEPFYTTREVGKGTGLGLSVIHGIISEMGGEILVASRKGEGSSFYVYLPVSKEYIAETGAVGERRRIFFIAGDKHESRILSIALERSGYDLTYIADRRNFIKVMNQPEDPPDMIIYMSGSKQVHPEDLMDTILNQKIDAPCILITESKINLIEEKLLNSGIINQHLIKPVSLKEIRNAISLCLS
jgi:signal transduction histidine kinase